MHSSSVAIGICRAEVHYSSPVLPQELHPWDSGMSSQCSSQRKKPNRKNWLDHSGNDVIRAVQCPEIKMNSWPSFGTNESWSEICGFYSGVQVQKSFLKKLNARTLAILEHGAKRNSRFEDRAQFVNMVSTFLLQSILQIRFN